MNMALDGASCVSETVSLKELVSKNCLPALVRLEEGIRGDIESLSLSSGDVIALVACSGADNGQGTVLAHYTVSPIGHLLMNKSECHGVCVRSFVRSLVRSFARSFVTMFLHFLVKRNVGPWGTRNVDVSKYLANSSSQGTATAC